MFALIFTRKLRSEEHTSELQSLITISYAVFCLKKKKKKKIINNNYKEFKNKNYNHIFYLFNIFFFFFIYYFFLFYSFFFFFFFNDTATTEIYTVMNTLSLHDALPIRGDLRRLAAALTADAPC